MTIAPALTIRVVSAPVFLATKWEAYTDRGNGELLGAMTEDIIAVVAGRETIVRDIEGAPRSVREWVATRTQGFLADTISDHAIEGALPDARFDPAVLTVTHRRLETITKLD